MSGELWTLQVKSLRAAFMSRPEAGQPGAAVQLAGVTSNNLAVSPEPLLAAAAAGMCFKKIHPKVHNHGEGPYLRIAFV